MIEFFLCSLVTILPDYLFRRYRQGKRLGQEITFFTVWYELRWGITAAMMLTIALITLVFFYHPTTSHVSSLFRTVTILPEGAGRVENVLVKNSQRVKEGELLFTLDASTEMAQVAAGQSEVDEIDAEIDLANTELISAEALISQAQGSYNQAVSELERTLDLQRRNSDVVTQKEIDTRENQVVVRKGQLDAAVANRDIVQTKISVSLPAQRSSAIARLHQAESAYDKKFVYAGVDGVITQFVLQAGDIVSPVLRPAGILVPDTTGYGRFQAGFGQITASVIRIGMAAEITCASRPFEVIPMVVVGVQDFISSGQFRPTDQLIDAQDIARPGTLLVVLEPLYEKDTSDIPPGSKCIANAYSNFGDQIAAGEYGFWGGLYYHMVDAVAIMHALILRFQALAFPVKVLVLSGH
ncbi:Inner membrane protein YiaV precursor [Pseudovibrio axinellae]|uniref:Inner membrane protein YiaV n=1 Tax=Pseudovibrio axinellae TaxID=989403 RepID=A0A165WYD3_9HYPH|nr:biotin/lipoyl-binding protein [Pseudovibrio axinellae]KZL17036.1 Inner membrane protein YiaV precursor [Pseudovibrio axinellae]SEQ17077.1 Multidrug resistance efflux pump [Pseudovibrio axinellae]